MAKLEKEIGNVLAELKRCWDAMDFKSLQKLWDKNEKEPWYLPEESDKFLFGWRDTQQYFQTTRKAFTRTSIRTWDLKVKQITPDIALAVYRMQWNCELPNYPKPLGGNNRVTALFRKKPEGWRFFHYIEAPLAPAVYLRQLLAKDADKEFIKACAEKATK